jgi:hypothetical protein
LLAGVIEEVHSKCRPSLFDYGALRNISIVWLGCASCDGVGDFGGAPEVRYRVKSPSRMDALRFNPGWFPSCDLSPRPPAHRCSAQLHIVVSGKQLFENITCDGLIHYM